MAAILRGSVAVAVAVVRTRPRAMPLAMNTIEKINSWVSLTPYIGMGLRLTALRAAGVLL